ncbi:putative protein TPRXL [Labeo rohita]|uniref:putative protein TPRXL n=1 Tax=Labeo rohita TaxID=84645 RepID=UPI0021E1C518|nr:putative protein TPRXL [Labeo rohita]
MRHFAVLYMCLLLVIVRVRSDQTPSTTVSSGHVTSHYSSQNTTSSNTSSTNTSTIPSLQSQSSQSTPPHPSTTHPQFNKPPIATSSTAKPPLTPTPMPGPSSHPQGSASAQYVHFGLLLISLMFLIVVEL